MKAADAYRGAIKLLKRCVKENPDSAVRLDGVEISAYNIVKELSKVVAWIHPELMTEEFVKVVRCNKCKHYKSYRKKGVFNAPSFKMCALEKVKRPSDYYCIRGEEK